MRQQAGVGKLKHAPPMQANDYLWWRRRFRLRTAFFHSSLTLGLCL
jgi:hypothetical protein